MSRSEEHAAYTEDKPAAAYELADTCAAVPAYGGKSSGKGSFCSFGYCTHACTADAECADVGSNATCSKVGDCQLE